MSLVACEGTPTTPKGQLNYQPPFLPVRFSIDTRGRISVVAAPEALKLLTPIGEFSISGGLEAAKKEPSGLKLVIRDRRKPAETVDTIYQIDSNDELRVVTDGRTVIVARQGSVVIDISDGTVRTIDVGPANNTATPAPPASPTTMPSAAPRRVAPSPKARPPAPPQLAIGVPAYCICSGPRGQESFKLLLTIRNFTSRPVSIVPTGSTAAIRLLVRKPAGTWTPPSNAGSYPVAVTMPDGSTAIAIPPNAPRQAEYTESGDLTFATYWRQAPELGAGASTNCSSIETGHGPRNRCDIVFYVPWGAETEILGVGYMSLVGGRRDLIAWLPYSAWKYNWASPRSF